MPVGGRGQRSPSVYPSVVETTGGTQNTGLRREEDIGKDQIAAKHQDFIGKQGASMEQNFVGEPGAFLGQAMEGEQGVTKDQGAGKAILKRKLYSESTGGPRILD